MIAAVLGGEDLRWFRAPGRVNLMGDHTDYNDGLVLPVAIDRDCLISGRPRSDAYVRVRSLDVDMTEGEVVVVESDGSTEPASVDPPWGRLVAGVVRALAERGRPPAGADAALSSTVPLGAGLASSAAFEVAMALTLCDAAGWSLPSVDLAYACRDAERTATGVPCGIMDQLVSLQGRAGQALLIDCRSLEVRPVTLPRDVAILVVHSGVQRTLEETGYAKRREMCETIARDLGLASLRDAEPERVRDLPLARHVLSEIARVRDTSRALDEDDRPALGRLFAESHAGLRDDFAVSTPQLDALVSALVEAGAIGARMTGAGFGGCVVSLVERRRVVHVAETATARYREETGLEPRLFVCRAAGGAGPA